jgi:hypothetical protein
MDIKAFQYIVAIVAAFGCAYCGKALATERRINTWLVCGTFACKGEKDFAADLIDAANVAPSPGQESAGVLWLICDDRLYCRNLDDYVDLYTFFNPVRPGGPAEQTNFSAAYAHTYVWSPAVQSARLLLGANDGYQVWLNGQLLRSTPDMMRTAIRDGDDIELSLVHGWNRLLLKVLNGRGIWGFYAKLADANGKNIDGLEYSVAPPDGDLRIVTESLPNGYTDTPYVWLQISGNEQSSPARAPSASPFRLSAAGGKPPYRWKIGSDNRLPPGLYLDGAEGEILGVTSDLASNNDVHLIVEDSTGAQASRTVEIAIAERPTRWLEKNQLVGLIHGAAGYNPNHGDPAEQAELLAKQGYSCAYPTTAWFILPETWPGNFDHDTFLGNPDIQTKMNGKLAAHQDMSAYKAEFNKRGIRFGTYVGLPDNVGYVFKKESDYQFWPCYQDALHRHFQDMCVEYQPAVFYLDGAHISPASGQDWNFDALYSIVKTLSSDSLMMPNLAGHAASDDCVGDADVVSVEGDNDRIPYWSRWPNHHSGRNPKFIPIASWRFPFSWAVWKGSDRFKADEPDYADWQEWTRVVISLIAEGYICDLDHTLGHGNEELHRQIGDWLHPRLDSLIGTRPGRLTDADWGYDVERDNTLYLHVMKNERGKRGLSGQSSLTVGQVSGAVRQVTLVPSEKVLSFEHEDDSITIDLTGVEADPVSTIIAIDLHH